MVIKKSGREFLTFMASVSNQNLIPHIRNHQFEFYIICTLNVLASCKYATVHRA